MDFLWTRLTSCAIKGYRNTTFLWGDLYKLCETENYECIYDINSKLLTIIIRADEDSNEYRESIDSFMEQFALFKPNKLIEEPSRLMGGRMRMEIEMTDHDGQHLWN
jgi:hypothetical protein